MTSTYVDGWVVGFGGATTATFGALGADTCRTGVDAGTLGAELASGWEATLGCAAGAGAGASDTAGFADACPTFAGTRAGTARRTATCAGAGAVVAAGELDAVSGAINSTGARNNSAHISVLTEPVTPRPLRRSKFLTAPSVSGP